jgi:amino acid transporter
VTSAGGAPGHGPVGFRYWTQEPFKNGLKGFFSVLPTCVFSMSGSENAGLVAAETANPKKAVPRAVGSIWLRLSLFYLLGALMITINVDPNNSDIFGQAGSNASPFVIAYREAGLPPLAHMMNAVIFISVLSTGTIQGYAGARTTMGLAHLGMAPSAFKHADATGRPWWGIFVTLFLGGGLAYLNVGNSAADVFTWLSNLTSLFTLFGWGMICLAHIRFRYTWKLQGRSIHDLPWKSWTFPFAAWWGLVWCILLIILQFYLSVWPLGMPSEVQGFFANYISIIVIVVCYLGARVYYRGPWWVDAATIDLDASRRFYVKDEAEKVVRTGWKKGAHKALEIVLN